MSIEKFNPTISGEIIPYTQINTKVIQNIENLEAGFVWVYLLTLPKDWKVMKSHLKKKFGIGEDKMKQIFAYLRKCNLIEYVRMRNKDGTLNTTEVRILNGNKFKNLQSKKSCATTGVKNHPQVNHTCGKHHTTKNIDNKENKKKEIKHSCASMDAHSKFLDFWEAYPKKKDKARSHKVWNRKGLDKIYGNIIHAVKTQSLYDSQWRDKQFIPNPSTYLVNELWNDEIVKDNLKPIKANNPSLEQRSTVREWGSGHPSYDSMYSAKIKR